MEDVCIYARVFVSSQVVRDVIRKVGYNHSSIGFDATTCNVLVAIDQQSPDIAQGPLVSQSHLHNNAYGVAFLAVQKNYEKNPTKCVLTNRFLSSAVSKNFGLLR